MKYVTLILIFLALALCAFAQEKGGSAETEVIYTVRSSVGLPTAGSAEDASNKMTALAPSTQTSASTAKRQPDPERPLAFGINSITPNPFNPACEIEFEIGEETDVVLEIYDISGRLVSRLIDNEEMTAGLYRISWDGAENPSGTYLARFTASGKTEVRRLVYLK
ncbi:MAG: T9SS type A sorting domain-containing protein [bacterium]